MNVYVVVEGEIGARKIYESWIPMVNSDLKPVNTIFDIVNNNYAVFPGLGYPSYNNTIGDAIKDINNVGNIDRLVIAVDSEDKTYDKKLKEIRDYLTDKLCSAEFYIVIQHFCFETWALGNKKFGPRSPRSDKLIAYKNLFNVLAEDPELLPGYPPEGLNRSQFAYQYLRTMIKNKNQRLTYRKNNPKVLLHSSYFQQIKNRFLHPTKHIQSFGDFINAFSP